MAAPEDPRRRRVGLLYDERMCRHATPDGESHPENPERIRAIWRKLESEGIPQRCVVLIAKEAEDKYVAPVHTQRHIKLIRNISSKEFDSRRLRIASKFNSIYFNRGSSEAAYLAAGSVVEVSEKVAKGDLDSAIAIVRPPGHHAESDEAMGFCLFNNVAIAANFLLNERPELGIRKILIVDWDVHHGNGTQNMFYKDPRVLFFSVHRFDFGSFYPAGDDGSYCMVGEGPGAGYNINVPWEHGQCGDADYLAVWDHVLLPVAESYNPDIILISAGFDAAVRDPLGGCCVTPYGYSLMLRKLMGFAQGKIVMALEGGYNLNSISNSVLACAKVLLEEEHLVGSIEMQPFESTWRVIQEVRHELKTFWPALAVELSQKVLVSNSRPCPAEVAPRRKSASASRPQGAIAIVEAVTVAEPLPAEPVEKGKGVAPEPPPKPSNEASAFEVSGARTLAEMVLLADDREVVASMGVTDMVGDGLVCLMKLVHYLHRLEEIHAEMSMRLAAAEGNLRSAGPSNQPKTAEKIKKLEHKLRKAEGLAEERAKEAVDLGRQLQEAEGMLRAAEKRAAEAINLGERLQRAEERARVSDIEVEGARDWARSAEAKLTDISLALEERRTECVGLREALEKAEANLAKRMSEAGRRAIEVFRSSSQYSRDLSEASVDAFSFGFEECLAKVARKHPSVDLGGIFLVDTPSSPQAIDSPASLPPSGDESEAAADLALEAPDADHTREA